MVWQLFERASGTWGLHRRNLITGQVHEAGELRRDTPITMILCWLMEHGHAAAGDLIP
jgi:hypothetical protein